IDVGCPGNAGPNNAYTIQNRNPLLSVYANVVLGGYNVANPTTCSAPSFFNRPAISISSSKSSCPTSGCPTTSCPGGFGCTSPGYVGGSQDEVFVTDGKTEVNLAPGDYVFCSFQT